MPTPGPSQKSAAVWSARRAIVITRVLLAVATAAIVISQLIFVTTNVDGAPSDSGARQLARFLAGISLPFVLIAAVLVLTVAVAFYVERLETNPILKDHGSTSEAGPGSPLHSPVPVVGREPTTLEDQPALPDDIAWRPK